MSQIKKVLDKPENQTKKTELSAQLTDIKSKLNNLLPQKSPEQAKTIQQLEEKIKIIKRELNLPDKSDNPPPHKDDNPGPSPQPPPENPQPGPDKNPSPSPTPKSPDNPSPSKDEPIEYVATKINVNTFKYHFVIKNANQEKLSWKSVIGLLSLKSKGFFPIFQGALKDANSKSPAYFWKCPPVSIKTLGKPFEFVVIKSEELNNITQNYQSFKEYLDDADFSGLPAVSFPNDRKPSDAILVIPSRKFSGNNKLDYKNLSQFTKNAPGGQQQALWQEVANKLMEELEKNPDAPRWLNTHGLGVHYLHVRIDESNRYYGDYEEYKKWE